MKDFSRFTISEVTKRFGERTALAGLSLELRRGEFVTFLGPSGCGKSTALGCIAGLVPITSGKISIDDECIDDGRTKVPPERREFGMVFQNYALFPHLSVANNVAFGLKLRKLAKEAVAQRVDAALKLVHLDGYADKFPAQMSGGEQQRVAIARCIVLEPRLLMLDEPLSNLDAKLRIEMRYELKALHERLHVTTIYVTHDQQEALALSDRIVVMQTGRVQQIGTPEEVYASPANLFVADFMGFKNIWTGRVESARESGDGIEYSVALDGFTLKVRGAYREGDRRRAAIMRRLNDRREVWTAIRPEDVQLGGQGDNVVRAKVVQVEYQGQVSQVTAVAGRDTRIDLRPSAPVASGGTIEVRIPPEKVLVFADGEAG